MPFFVSGNMQYFTRNSLRNLEKFLGVILSPHQYPLEQYNLIKESFQGSEKTHSVMQKLKREELLSFIFLLTQFGDLLASETPPTYLNFGKNPFVVEWAPGHFMVPLEIMEHLSSDRMFRNQNYLFALLPILPVKEKKAWWEWIDSWGFSGNASPNLDHQLYLQCRHLQKPFGGKSLVQEETLELERLWPQGKVECMDWFYKGLVPFYGAMKDLQKKERDPLLKHIVELVRSGKMILKKAPERYGEPEQFVLVSTVEGNTPQLRNTLLHWEKEPKTSDDSLF